MYLVKSEVCAVTSKDEGLEPKSRCWGVIGCSLRAARNNTREQLHVEPVTPTTNPPRASSGPAAAARDNS